MLSARGRRRAAWIEAAAEAAQEAERQAARKRLIDAARRNGGREWHEAPTRPLPVVDRPLMTPAQIWRGNGGRRW